MYARVVGPAVAVLGRSCGGAHAGTSFRATCPATLLPGPVSARVHVVLGPVAGPGGTEAHRKALGGGVEPGLTARTDREIDAAAGLAPPEPAPAATP